MLERRTKKELDVADAVNVDLNRKFKWFLYEIYCYYMLLCHTTYLWAFLWRIYVVLATNFKHASIILFILFRWLIKFFFMSQIICPRVFCSVFKNGIMQIQLSHLQNGIIILRKKERKMNFEKPATRATVLYIKGKKWYRNGCTITLKGKTNVFYEKNSLLCWLLREYWLANIGAAVSDKLYLLADFVFCKQFCFWHFFADFHSTLWRPFTGPFFCMHQERTHKMLASRTLPASAAAVCTLFSYKVHWTAVFKNSNAKKIPLIFSSVRVVIYFKKFLFWFKIVKRVCHFFFFSRLV